MTTTLAQSQSYRENVNFIRRTLSKAQISCSSLICSLWYIDQYFQQPHKKIKWHPKDLFLASIVVADKYMYDDAWINYSRVVHWYIYIWIGPMLLGWTLTGLNGHTLHTQIKTSTLWRNDSCKTWTSTSTYPKSTIATLSATWSFDFIQGNCWEMCYCYRTETLMYWVKRWIQSTWSDYS